MKRFLFLLLFITKAYAEVTPDDVHSMIDQMVARHVISPEEAEKTKKRIQAMSNDEWQKLKEAGHKVAQRAPASISTDNTIREAAKGADLDKAQLQQIQSDMTKIVPQY